MGMDKAQMIQEGLELQKEYCEKYEYPMFCPSTGYCFCCGAAMFSPYNYSMNDAGHVLITGCRVCGKSFVD